MKTRKNNKQTIKKTKKKKYIGGNGMTQEEIIIQALKVMNNCVNNPEHPHCTTSQIIKDIKHMIDWVNKYDDAELKNKMVKILSPLASNFTKLNKENNEQVKVLEEFNYKFDEMLKKILNMESLSEIEKDITIDVKGDTSQLGDIDIMSELVKYSEKIINYYNAEIEDINRRGETDKKKFKDFLNTAATLLRRRAEGKIQEYLKLNSTNIAELIEEVKKRLTEKKVEEVGGQIGGKKRKRQMQSIMRKKIIPNMLILGKKVDNIEKTLLSNKGKKTKKSCGCKTGGRRTKRNFLRKKGSRKRRR